MKRYIFCLSVAMLLLNSCIEEPKISEDTPEGNFEALWSIIDTRYCYLTYKEIDWDAMHSKYAKKVDRLYNTDYNQYYPYDEWGYDNYLNYENKEYALFDIFGEMLAELKDGHVNLYSNFDISRYDKWYTDSADNYNSSVVFSDNYVGKKFRVAGGFRYGTLRNNSDIGYIGYSSFSNGFSDANVRNIFQSFSDCKGLIIDVRNNGGGALNYSEQLASYFFEEETIIGYMRFKNGSGHDDLSEPTAVKTPAHESIHWERPVIVLTNRLSYSATNDFVNRMNQAPNAYTVGSWTGGGGGMPLSSELPNGWMVRFSACPMYDINMNHTEMGIAPDYHVITTAEDAEQGIDAVIDKAVEIIKSN